jgi:hypothetical protein
MTKFADSYVTRVLFATPAPGRGVDVGVDLVARRWHWLRSSLFDRFGPELHYMRGPGPKWREKHRRPANPCILYGSVALPRNSQHEMG